MTNKENIKEQIDLANREARMRWAQWPAEDKLALIREALDDYKFGQLSDTAIWTVVAGIVYPPTLITEEIWEWAQTAIEKQDKEAETILKTIESNPNVTVVRKDET